MKKTITKPVNNPDIGVVMPIYKQDLHYLQLALTSILNQSYRNFMLVIVLDGAPAEVINRVNALTKQDPRVKVIDKRVNGGVSNALNTGFEYLYKIPSIKYLTWVSSDNIHYYRMIEKLRNGFTTNIDNRIGLVYSSFWHIDDKGVKTYTETSREALLAYQDQPKSQLFNYCFIGTCFLYKKDIAQRIRGYYLEPVEDYDYWLRFTENCEIKFIKEMLMEYRVNSPQSISSQLKSSTDQHRKWRNSFNIARFQARKRQVIPTELTIVVPLHYRSPINLDSFERIFEQYYSNFEVLLIDNSKNGEAKSLIQKIPDPRMKIIETDNTTKLSSLVQYALPYITTPFATVFPESGVHYHDKYYIHNVMDQKKYHSQTFQKGAVYISENLRKILGGQ
ncbi:glycosyltransferase family 2 protein [Rossellomorea vietnamensis]|uniref:glycosyltransferase family 2 protein n=1 Tax=Rossellomorea vietnamensis TaxID=218284 RepID=UPI0007612B58|nr:glycosyltransferase [Rossellomorea vietnamensis]